MFQCMALLFGSLWYRPCCSPAKKGLEARGLLCISWSCIWSQGTLQKEKENNDKISVYSFQGRAAPQRKIIALMKISGSGEWFQVPTGHDISSLPPKSQTPSGTSNWPFKTTLGHEYKVCYYLITTQSCSKHNELTETVAACYGLQHMDPGRMHNKNIPIFVQYSAFSDCFISCFPCIASRIPS